MGRLMDSLWRRNRFSKRETLCFSKVFLFFCYRTTIRSGIHLESVTQSLGQKRRNSVFYPLCRQDRHGDRAGQECLSSTRVIEFCSTAQWGNVVCLDEKRFSCLMAVTANNPQCLPKAWKGAMFGITRFVVVPCHMINSSFFESTRHKFWRYGKTSRWTINGLNENVPVREL